MSYKQRYPIFKYHPDPLKTKNAEEKKFQCICCEEEKNIAYIAGIYTSLDVEREEICLDCIFDGSAAKKFDATFTDFTGNAEDLEMSEENWSEFYERTPGYISWQDQTWLTHCRRICSFHGDFEPAELQQIYCEEENKKYLKENLGCNDQELNEIIFTYNPNKSTQPSFYKFECFVCKKVLVHTDFT